MSLLHKTKLNCILYAAKGVFVMTDSFAERLARALDARDVKQVELAEKTGISKSAISQYLSGAFVPK